MRNLKKRAPAEDIFHRIQEPVAPAANEPFVGNESVDDDLFECVKVALWNAMDGKPERIVASVRGGSVTLTGDVASRAARRRCEVAVKALARVTEVINELRYPTARPTAPKGKVARPMIYVTRFCAPEPASHLAAIRSGLEILDASGLAGAETIILYRNRMPHSITVEIGRSAEFAVADADAELKRGTHPASPTLSTMTAGLSITEILAAHDALLDQAKAAGKQPGDYFWHLLPDGITAAGQPIAVFLPIAT